METSKCRKLVQDAQFLPQYDVAGEWLCPVDNYGVSPLIYVIKINTVVLHYSYSTGARDLWQ